MLSEHHGQRVYLARGPTDLRRSIDGLAAIVQLEFELNPFDACLFVFCNRRQDKVKILEWADCGFWLHYFRLEKGRFQWPNEMEGSTPLAITRRELRWLLDGLPLRPTKQHSSVKAQYAL